MRLIYIKNSKNPFRIDKEETSSLPFASGTKRLRMIGASVESVGMDERTMSTYLDHQFSIESLMKTDLKMVTNKRARCARERQLSQVASGGR